MSKNDHLTDLVIRLLPHFRLLFLTRTFNVSSQKEKEDLLIAIIEKAIETWGMVLKRAKRVTHCDNKFSTCYLDVWELDDDMLPLRFNKKLFVKYIGMHRNDCEKIFQAFSMLREELEKNETMLPKEMRQLLELDEITILE